MTDQYVVAVCGHAERLPQAFDVAFGTVQESQTLFERSMIHPFWDSIGNTFELVSQINYLLVRMAYYKLMYYRQFENAYKTPPEFIDLNGVQVVYALACTLFKQQTVIVDKSHESPPFSEAYGPVRIENKLYAGFNSLNHRRMHLEARINFNTKLLRWKLSDVESKLSECESHRATLDGNDVPILSSADEISLREYLPGMRKATGPISPECKNEQTKFNRVLQELNQMRLRLESEDVRPL